MIHKFTLFFDKRKHGKCLTRCSYCGYTQGFIPRESGRVNEKSVKCNLCGKSTSIEKGFVAFVGLGERLKKQTIRKVQKTY